MPLLLMLVSMAGSAADFAQVPSLSTEKKPAVSIVIDLRPGIKPKSEVSLEIAMTNTSDADIGYGIVCGWPTWALNFVIDVRGAEDDPVRATPEGEKALRGPEATSCTLVALLKPGETLRQQLALNRMFNLAQSEECSVSVAFHGINSNTIRFRVPPVKSL